MKTQWTIDIKAAPELGKHGAENSRYQLSGVCNMFTQYGVVMTRVDALKVGDLVDLISDKYSNAGGHPEYEFEYAEVEEIERETNGCICVYFNTVTIGFPPDHLVPVRTVFI